jgi:chorismate mutase
MMELTGLNVNEKLKKCIRKMLKNAMGRCKN